MVKQLIIHYAHLEWVSGVREQRQCGPSKGPACHPPDQNSPWAATLKGEGQGPPQQHWLWSPRATTHSCCVRVIAEKYVGQPQTT